ncbi:MAG: hypothetical protein KGZ80_03680 [Methylomonas sp.]|nr:hypothetical protein [Methylomonas sp.]PPD22852.1 MAG: hypothetical protein CTY23_00565 [Methylomonas sp.]PPD41868.1 MAG: hypothetical protein CTY17_02840 [Methylomonas sp.]PPD51633.1 MAG: hypothetical protein CTY11_11775 [Methylomonas sp.]
MRNPMILAMPLLLMACGETVDSRYRDLHELEMPPVLPIEHHQAQTAVGDDDFKPKPTSPLAGLVDFKDDEHKPRLILKTRPERAWEMLTVALKLTNIHVIDKNREVRLIQVRYDPDLDGKEVGMLGRIFGDTLPEADYNIMLKEDKTESGFLVNVAPSQSDDIDSDEDASAELIRLLHKTIDEKIINRQ